MTTWNYRVRNAKYEVGDYYEIVEVYYDEDGNVVAQSQRGIAPGGETVNELRADLMMMLAALDKPELDKSKEMYAHTERVNRTGLRDE